MPPIHAAHLSRRFSTAEALHGVFVGASRTVLGTRNPALHLYSPLFLAPQLFTARRQKSTRSQDVIADLLEQEQKRDAERRVPAAVRFLRPDRDEGIRARYVVLVDRQTKKLTEPLTLHEVLMGMDRRSEFLLRVGQAPPAAALGAGLDPSETPLCKIVPKREVFEQEEQKARQAAEAKKRKKRREGKTLELGWNTAEGDLAHRFRKAEEFLQNGDRVNFMFENRQKRKVVPMDKAESLLGKVNEAMGLIPKVAEVEREGKLGGKMKVVFERGEAG